jgi:hypothetical protein
MQRVRTELRRKLMVSAAARRLQEIDEEIENIYRAFPALRGASRNDPSRGSQTVTRERRERSELRRASGAE